MSSKKIQIYSFLFLALATTFPIMRLNGYPDSDLPAFGALIIAIVMITMINTRILTLEKTLKELKDDVESAKKNTEDTNT